MEGGVKQRNPQTRKRYTQKKICMTSWEVIFKGSVLSWFSYSLWFCIRACKLGLASGIRMWVKGTDRIYSYFKLVFSWYYRVPKETSCRRVEMMSSLVKLVFRALGSSPSSPLTVEYCLKLCSQLCSSKPHKTTVIVDHRAIAPLYLL